MKVAISGFGRIGKMFLRAVVAQGALGKEIEIVAINTRSAVEMHAHLFKYDSAFGKFDGTVEVKNGNLAINGYEIKWIRETDPLKLPWKDLNIDFVLESSGEFTKRADAEKHLNAGAKFVLISAPGKGVDATIVLGVNEEKFDPATMTIVSLASCTTNCLAPVLKVLDKKFGIECGFLSTVHAYTNDQRLLDGSHEKDWRRARAGAVNIIPTSTGAAKAVGEVLPQMNGKLDGVAFRVPVPNGSMNDMTLELKNAATVAEINEELKRASHDELRGIIEYTEEPIVSSDIIGNPHSAIVDGPLTKAIGKLVKVSAWYDNEYGYSNRLVDFVRLVGRKK
ncbi:TPA: type I glyceraldehyde-3-phosphate dehydrogenase [Candidatus Micrarchaeota archaeon]|nr:type I glyceraldehyde-3-phosphate dehydrogenase [Candidatus Micrarchaeota archaeon]